MSHELSAQFLLPSHKTNGRTYKGFTVPLLSTRLNNILNINLSLLSYWFLKPHSAYMFTFFFRRWCQHIHLIKCTKKHFIVYKYDLWINIISVKSLVQKLLSKVLPYFWKYSYGLQLLATIMWQYVNISLDVGTVGKAQKLKTSTSQHKNIHIYLFELKC